MLDQPDAVFVGFERFGEGELAGFHLSDERFELADGVFKGDILLLCHDRYSVSFDSTVLMSRP